MIALNVPLTDTEKEGLLSHGIPPGTPLSDAFRLGMAYALGNMRRANFGFRVVNSGGMWEVYEKVSDTSFRKLNPVASSIDHLSINRNGSIFEVQVAVKPYPHIGYRPKTPVAQG